MSEKKIKLVYEIPYNVYCWVVCISVWLTVYFAIFVWTLWSDRKEAVYSSVSRRVAGFIMRMVGVKINVVGRENIPATESVIFVSNHQSFIDIKLALACVPKNFSFISKETVFKVPFVGRYMKTAGHISLKRDAGKKAYDTMNEVVKKLNNGKSFVIFPEGTRSPDGKLGKFKRGISLLILQSGCKVVPMAIVGSGEFLSKKRLLFNPLKTEMTVRFGKPLIFEKKDDAGREEVNSVVDDLRDAVVGLLSEGR